MANITGINEREYIETLGTCFRAEIITTRRSIYELEENRGRGRLKKQWMEVIREVVL